MSMNELWGYKIQLLPILISWLIVEIPNWLRRIKKIYYIPIYFLIFPLRELNKDLSYYLGEDFFIGYGESLDSKKLKRLKKKIIFDSVISIFISAVIIPCFAGFIFAFILNKELLLQSVICIMFYKVIRILLALKDFKKHAVGSKKNIIRLILIYIGYLGVFIQMLKTSFNWASPFVITKNWNGLFNSLTELVFNKVILQSLLLAVLTAVFVSFFTDIEIRNKNLKK